MKDEFSGHRAAEALVPDKPAVLAWLRMLQAYNKMVRALEGELADRGLTLPQYAVLRWLGSYGEMSLSDLGRRLLVTCGNVTGLIDRLERDGLVERRRNADDRRVVRARLTERGRHLYGQVVPEQHERLARFLSCLTEAQQREMAGLLDTLIVHLEETARTCAASPPAAPAGPPARRKPASRPRKAALAHPSRRPE